MSAESWITVLALLVGALVIAYMILASSRKTGTLVTSEQIHAGVDQIKGLAAELEKVGLMAVASADQIIKGEGLNVNDLKFQEAFQYVDKWSNTILGIDLDPEMVKKIVEGSYKIYKETITKQDFTANRSMGISNADGGAARYGEAR